MNRRSINIMENVVTGIVILFVITILFMALWEPVTVTLFGGLEDEAAPILDRNPTETTGSDDYAEYIAFLIVIFGVTFSCAAIAVIVGMYLHSVKYEHEEYEEYEQYR